MKRIFSLCILAAACTQSFASTAITYYAGGGGGLTSPSISRNNYVPTGTGWPDDHYVSRNVTNPQFLFVNAGLKFSRETRWLPYYSVGLRYTYTSTMTIKGYIDQYSLPGFNNYSFSYDNQQQNLFAILKGDIIRWHNLLPYLTAGAGISANMISSYSETALGGVTPRVSPGFASHTNYNLAYMLGAGIEYIMFDNWWLNLEYNYSDFGTIQTGQGANYTSLSGFNFSNSTLKNSLTTNNLLLGITYYFA